MPFSIHLETIHFPKESIELFVPDNDAVKEAYQKGNISFPYWSQVWPSAKALAAYLLLRPEITAAKNVIELGAGLGMPSLVAARNATSVLCTDYAVDAVNIVKKSAAHHQLQNLQTAVIDWLQMPLNLDADVVLLSDINYEPAAFDALMKLIRGFLQEGKTIVLSTPQRLMAKNFIAALMAFCQRQEEVPVVHLGEMVLISILVLHQ